MPRLASRFVASIAIALLCFAALSGTSVGEVSASRTQVFVAGLIPPEIAEALSKAAGIQVKGLPQEGSLGIVAALREGSIEFGAATSDASYLAFTGQLPNGVAPFDKLRGITVLALKTIHLMVAKNSPARSIGDFRGLNVSLGPPGTGTSLVAELLLKAHGLTVADIREEYLPVPEAVKRLASGQIDAAFMPVVAPAPDATLAARSGARLLEIAGPKVEELRLQHPFLLRTLLPLGTYPGQHKSIHTIAVDLLLVCREDVDERLVYNFLQTYFANLARSTAATDLNRATAMSIPLHAGAARYYRERELSR
jgi:uncharacterized protein